MLLHKEEVSGLQPGSDVFCLYVRAELLSRVRALLDGLLFAVLRKGLSSFQNMWLAILLLCVQ